MEEFEKQVLTGSRYDMSSLTNVQNSMSELADAPVVPYLLSRNKVSRCCLLSQGEYSTA